MMKKTLILACIILLTILSMQAQKSYSNGSVILLNNDTIVGRVKMDLAPSQKSICYIKNKKSVEKYAPEQIKGIIFEDGSFYSGSVVSDRFVEVLVKGKLSLYKDEGGVFYIQKDGDKLHPLTSKIKKGLSNEEVIREYSRWRGLVSALIADCNSDQYPILSNTMNERILTETVTIYNQCSNSAFILYKGEQKWVVVKNGISIGLNQTSLIINALNDRFNYFPDRYTINNISFGIANEFMFPRVNNNLAIEIDFLYSNAKYESLIEAQSGTVFEVSDVKIDLHTLSTPISAKYFFSHTKNRVFFQAGASFDFLLKGTATRNLKRTIFNGMILESDRNPFVTPNRLRPGVILGLGYEINLGKFKVDSSLRFYQMSTMEEFNDLKANERRIALNFIFSGSLF